MITEMSRKQRLALTWWCDRSRYRRLDAIICDGAVRSGKTLFLGLSFVCWAMRRFEEKQFGVCGKTIVSLKRNVLRPLLPLLGELGFTYEYARSQNTLTVSAGRRKNLFRLFGGRDESSAALIQGVTLAGVFFDEVVLQPRSFVEQACARCSVPGSKFFFSCNPEGPEHWFYTEWIRKAKERRALYLHFTMADNPSLTPDIRKRYERLYSGVFYRRFVLGQWAAAEGRVYDFFTPDMAGKAPETCEKWYVSCDYGTLNPASFGLWGLHGGVWYRVKEYYFDSKREGRQKTDAEYVEDLKRLTGGRTVTAVIVDPSAASFIEALRREGFCVVKAKNDVLSGIRKTADALKTGRLVICEGCADTLREMELYVWESGGGRDAPKKENDHAMDDMRYFAATVPDIGDEMAATWVER